jgi:hypothetical protein
MNLINHWPYALRREPTLYHVYLVESPDNRPSTNDDAFSFFNRRFNPKSQITNPKSKDP